MDVAQRSGQACSSRGEATAVEAPPPNISKLLPPLPRRRLAVLRSPRAAEEVGELVGACMAQDGGTMCVGLQEAAPLNTRV